MTTRQHIPQKTRFEVFKRDSFTCQYCGKMAPDVILEVDHIQPISKGGKNDIMNLITSCFDCNRGKSNKTLDDNSVLAKQRDQLKNLNERRCQIEMMIQWREGLSELNQTLAAAMCEEIESLGNITITNPIARASVAKWTKQFSYDVLIEAAKRAFAQYNNKDEAFGMIPRIAHFVANPQKQPIARAMYIYGIAKNRFGRYDYLNVRPYIIEASKHIDTDAIRFMALTCEDWQEFKDELQGVIKDGDENGSKKSY